MQMDFEGQSWSLSSCQDYNSASCNKSVLGPISQSLSLYELNANASAKFPLLPYIYTHMHMHMYAWKGAKHKPVLNMGEV